MKGWKTLIFGAALAVFGVMESFDWTSVVSEGTAGYIVTGIGVAVMVLRALTTTPVLKKD